MLSAARFIGFLRRLCWWVNTANIWEHEELAFQYIEACWDNEAAVIAAEMLQPYCATLLRNRAPAEYVLAAEAA